MRISRGLSLAVTILLCLLTLTLIQQAHAAETLTGKVTDNQGHPLRATVVTFTKQQLVRTTSAGNDGAFSMIYDANVDSAVIFYDDPTTPGYDFGPTMITLGVARNLTVELKPAASVKIIGDILFVDTENIPSGYIYHVVDSNGVVLRPNGFPLSFSTRQEGLRIPGLLPAIVVIPADLPFRLSLSSTLLIGNKPVARSIFSDVQEPLEQGTLTEFDVRGLTLKNNLVIVEAALIEAKQKTVDLEKLGFYIVREKAILSSAEISFASANLLYESGRYIDGLDVAKKSYIDAKRTIGDLNNLYVDASSSVYILIGFLAIASITAGYLFADVLPRQVLLSLSFFTGALLVLNRVYPGTAATTIQSFIITSIISFLAVMGIAFLFPRLLKNIGSDGQVGLLALLVPVVSIAKRSLRRRRLRFFLTLLSLSVMVTSFVALTSLSEGYGLMSLRVSKTPTIYPGVVLRDSTWTEAVPTFILFSDMEVAWLSRQPGVEVVSLKIENMPQLSQLDNVKGAPINTIVGIESAVESKILPLDSMIVEGKLPGSGGVALSRILVNTLNLKIGDTVKIKTQTLKLEGVFDDVVIERFSDLDGSRYLPDRLVNLAQPGDPPLIDRILSKGVETAIIDVESAKMLPPLVVTRIAVKATSNTQDAFAEKIALLRGYQTWSASDFGVVYKSLGSYLEGKGLPLIIPWAIVVLNVVVTMLNSLFERRREISILSSVGLNPAEIASIFVAEASITGFIAGGLGYLAGISFYTLMPLIGITLEVHQKVSAIWSLAAIGIAISAVLVGAFAALRSSIVITPSLLRKWKIEEGNGIGSSWEVPIPMRLELEDIEGFINYLLRRLQGFENGEVRRTANIKTEKRGNASAVTFIFKSPQPSTGNFYTRNTVLIEPRGGGYSLRLESVGSQEWVHETGSLVRLITMEWSNRVRK